MGSFCRTQSNKGFQQCAYGVITNEPPIEIIGMNGGSNLYTYEYATLMLVNQFGFLMPGLAVEAIYLLRDVLEEIRANKKDLISFCLKSLLCATGEVFGGCCSIGRLL